jgi:hypothetical protein
MPGLFGSGNSQSGNSTLNGNRVFCAYPPNPDTTSDRSMREFRAILRLGRRTHTARTRSRDCGMKAEKKKIVQPAEIDSLVKKVIATSRLRQLFLNSVKQCLI